MLNRQKVLLRLLGDHDGHCSKLELTKLAFLLAQEGRSEQLSTFYEFVPYKFGPYSFTLAHELGSLSKEGLVSVSEEEQIELTAKGKKLWRQALEVRLARDVELLHQNYGHIDQKKLIDLVYEKYPWFTANSQFPNKRKAKKIVVEKANYTIGYQSFQVDGLLNRLLESGIKSLIDTRSNPVSRRYGFHKSSLSKLSGLVGIKYEHCPEVGVPSSWRQELQTDGEYKILFKRYEGEVLDEIKDSVERLAEAMKAEPSVLLCRESLPTHCHRTVLAKRLSIINGLETIDLTPLEEKPDQPLVKFNQILLK